MDDTDREDAEMKTKKVIKVNFFFFFFTRGKNSMGWKRKQGARRTATVPQRKNALKIIRKRKE